MSQQVKISSKRKFIDERVAKAKHDNELLSY